MINTTEAKKEGKRNVLYVGSDLSDSVLDTLETKGYNILQAEDANHALNSQGKNYAAVIIGNDSDYIRVNELRSKLGSTPFMVLPNEANMGRVIPNCYTPKAYTPENLSNLLESEEFVNSAKTPETLTLKDLGTHVSELAKNAYSSIAKSLVPQFPYHVFKNNAPVYARMHKR